MAPSTLLIVALYFSNLLCQTVKLFYGLGNILFYCTIRNITIYVQILRFEGVTLARSEPATKKALKAYLMGLEAKWGSFKCRGLMVGFPHPVLIGLKRHCHPIAESL